MGFQKRRTRKPTRPKRRNPSLAGSRHLVGSDKGLGQFKEFAQDTTTPPWGTMSEFSERAAVYSMAAQVMHLAKHSHHKIVAASWGRSALLHGEAEFRCVGKLDRLSKYVYETSKGGE